MSDFLLYFCRLCVKAVFLNISKFELKLIRFYLMFKSKVFGDVYTRFKFCFLEWDEKTKAEWISSFENIDSCCMGAALNICFKKSLIKTSEQLFMENRWILKQSKQSKD